MARGVNKVIIVGNLGQDPESRSFPDGGMIVNVSVATSESWKDKQTGQQQERTEWHRVVFRNKLAEIAQTYLHKGSKVYIEGSLRTRKWQNQQGQDQYSTEVIANQMQMLDSRPEGQQGQQQTGYGNNYQQDYQQQQQNAAAYQAAQSGGIQQPPVYQPAPAQPDPASVYPDANINQQQPPQQQQQPAPAAGGFNDFDDDIPFSNYQLKVLV